MAAGGWICLSVPLIFRAKAKINQKKIFAHELAPLWRFILIRRVGRWNQLSTIPVDNHVHERLKTYGNRERARVEHELVRNSSLLSNRIKSIRYLKSSMLIFSLIPTPSFCQPGLTNVKVLTRLGITSADLLFSLPGRKSKVTLCFAPWHHANLLGLYPVFFTGKIVTAE